MPYRPDDFGIFTTPDRATIQADLRKINDYLFNFSRNTGIADFIAHDEVLFEVIERVEKRRVYFHIFYDGCNMGEINEVSLLCFWILKRQSCFWRKACSTLGSLEHPKAVAVRGNAVCQPPFSASFPSPCSFRWVSRSCLASCSRACWVSGIKDR
jgi:hypothetical protein